MYNKQKREFQLISKGIIYCLPKKSILVEMLLILLQYDWITIGLRHTILVCSNNPNGGFMLGEHVALMIESNSPFRAK